jgi:hypothetical protein
MLDLETPLKFLYHTLLPKPPYRLNSKKIKDIL